MNPDRTLAPEEPEAILDRTFAAVVIDWDAMDDPAAGAARSTSPEVCERIESLCAIGVHVAVISAHEVGEVDAQLAARPSGPGALLLGLGRGTELYEVGRTGPRLLLRRGEAADADILALDRATESIVDALGERGIKTGVRATPDRRAIELQPADVSGSGTEDGSVVSLQHVSVAERDELIALATELAAAAGLAAARVTCDERRLEIGITDKSDSMLDILEALAGEGIGPGLVLIVTGQVGPVVAIQRSDAVWISEAARATTVSVGSEPEGTPPGVLSLGGGCAELVRLLDEQLNRSRLLRVPNVDLDPAWTLHETGSDPKLHRVNETLFTVGAGGIATRGSVEEPLAQSMPMVLAAGVYRGAGSEQHLLPAPVWTELALTTPPVEDVRVLDMRTGVLYREEVHPDGLPFRSLRFASLSLPGVVAMRAEAGRTGLDPGPPTQPPREGATTEGTDNGRHWMRVGSDGAGGIGAVATQRVAGDGDRDTVERLAAYVADSRQHPALPEAYALLDTAGRRGFERVLAEHRSEWASRWDTVDIRIPDDPGVEKAIRYALFQLWCNTGRHDELAVGARGLSGPGYSGHVFWDADIFVLPALVSMDPAAAQAMVTYRRNRLEAARVLARASGRSGARFPWESAATGEDVTPAFGQLGGKAVPILTGVREEHITADVAWAAVHCAQWRGAQITATSPEWAILRETARYWASRCRRDADGTAHIDDVIGPDEYHELVNDNTFTNVMARWNLRVAADLGESLRGMDEECRRWRELAAQIVDGYDPSTNLYEQFQGYYNLEPLLVHDYAPPPIAADVYFGRDRVAASQTIKQPDVLMLHHLIPDDVAPGSLGPNLDFYGPRTAHGSTLSPAISASLLARAGRSDNALSMLRLALTIDLDDLNGTTAAGLHLATLGGVWQAILAGFLGVRVRDSTLTLDPDLPTVWRSLEVRFRCVGRRVRVRATPGRLDVSTDGPLQVKVAGREPREVTGRASFDR